MLKLTQAYIQGKERAEGLASTPEQLRAARKSLGMNQAQFADALGLNRCATVSDMETGKVAITRQTQIIVDMLLRENT